IPGDFRIRFMTSHPRDAGEKLFRTMAECEKCAKHIHLPFQSGSDRILKLMNRHYDLARYKELVAMARSYMPDIVLTSDVIVGFPGETEEDFEGTMDLVRSVRYDALFTFIFSPRKGTPAYSMPDPFTRQEKQQRFDRLVSLQNSISEEKHRQYVGGIYRVLCDGAEGDLLTGRTDGGRLVRFAGPESLIGSFLPVRITSSSTWALGGQIEKGEANG
ncbi:MAG: radical SAM protein, partial [Oscillospiraceae bacterium]|nr:radical SAM protein [Oscillospiraceae bacterium]